MESSLCQTLEIGQVLDLLFRKLGYDKKIREQQAMFWWNEVVGEHVAAHAQPTQIDNGKMSVVVSDSIWLTELNLLRMQYIAKINEKLGALILKDIDFKIGKVNKTSERIPLRRIEINEDYGKKLEGIELGPEELRIINQTVADVEDEELGEILKQIFTNQRKSIKLKN
ncbi:DUF721 domain-containing protein [Candidatus Poribacteria bacterium]|nr:DUF721 domain-containing protein [Candidatus Poribacteria bacterium]